MALELGLSGRVVLVTGSSQGLGRDIARGFAREGARVVVNGRKRDKLEPVVAELQALGAEAIAVPGDVREFAAVEALVTATVERFGRLDVLINNAGGSFACPSDELSPNGWAAVLGINLTGAFHACKAAYPVMKGQGGGIVINIASVVGLRGSPRQVAYGAAKAGLIQMTKTLAVEWAPAGIRMNAIVPGRFVTEGFVATHLLTEEMRRERLADIPLGRFGEPEEITKLCLYLASGHAGFMTGSAILIDGGQTPGI